MSLHLFGWLFDLRVANSWKLLIQYMSELLRLHRAHPLITINPPEPSLPVAVAGSAHFLARENLSLDSSTAGAFRASIYRVLFWSVWNSLTTDVCRHDNKYDTE